MASCHATVKLINLCRRIFCDNIRKRNDNNTCRLSCFSQKQAEEEKALGGLILPKSEENKQGVFTILAVGSDKSDKTGALEQKMPVSVGDTVIAAPYAGHKLELDDADSLGEERYVFNADDIIAIIK